MWLTTDRVSAASLDDGHIALILIGRLVAGREAHDVDDDADVGQGVVEIEFGHRTARLRHLLCVVGEEQVVRLEVGVGGVGDEARDGFVLSDGGDGAQGAAVDAVLVGSPCEGFARLWQAVADVGMGVGGVAPVDGFRHLFGVGLGEALLFVAVPTTGGLSFTHGVIEDDARVVEARNGTHGALDAGEHHLVVVDKDAAPHVIVLVERRSTFGRAAGDRGVDAREGYGLIAGNVGQTVVRRTGGQAQGEYEKKETTLHDATQEGKEKGREEIRELPRQRRRSVLP